MKIGARSKEKYSVSPPEVKDGKVILKPGVFAELEYYLDVQGRNPLGTQRITGDFQLDKQNFCNEQRPICSPQLRQLIEMGLFDRDFDPKRVPTFDLNGQARETSTPQQIWDGTLFLRDAVIGIATGIMLDYMSAKLNNEHSYISLHGGGFLRRLHGNIIVGENFFYNSFNGFTNTWRGEENILDSFTPKEPNNKITADGEFAQMVTRVFEEEVLQGMQHALSDVVFTMGVLPKNHPLKIMWKNLWKIIHFGEKYDLVNSDQRGGYYNFIDAGIGTFIFTTNAAAQGAIERKILLERRDLTVDEAEEAIAESMYGIGLTFAHGSLSNANILHELFGTQHPFVGSKFKTEDLEPAGNSHKKFRVRRSSFERAKQAVIKRQGKSKGLQYEFKCPASHKRANGKPDVIAGTIGLAMSRIHVLAEKYRKQQVIS